MLTIAVLMLLIRSYTQLDAVLIAVSDDRDFDDKPAKYCITFASREGSLMFGTHTIPTSPYMPDSFEYISASINDRWGKDSRDFDFIGFRHGISLVHGFFYGVPQWFIAGLLIALELFLCRRWLRRAHDANACPACGYDTRGTPGRCPECGWSATPKAMDAK